MSAINVNYSASYDGISIRVICPVCGIGGGQNLFSYQPKCHICTDKVMMLPASNNEIECTWEEAQKYARTNKHLSKFIKLKGIRMSLVSYTDLVLLVERGVINAPLEHINGSSIDLTLGEHIMVEKVGKAHNSINLMAKETIAMTEVRLSEDGYDLKPDQFILASTAETFNLPNNIAAEYKLKSSLARSGLEHMLAGWCDPGWTNSKLTLELKNATQYHNLLLKPGMKIGQIVFWQCEPVPEEESYAVKGQYNEQDKATESKGAR